ncbi:GntR family transcriptional regulator [Gottfriedia acidiceleris]|uniref:GntR family transcriptional regulator n=1 Tax=Bacillaceae TaxID=186817 RepID=UPI000BEB8A26|nr:MULTISPECIES: GntR family transcriptional regulator [unclassified Bacillus (in: firmicutes)]PEC47559.1 phosphonate metabolism transcriptional regulator PhnF [Bacillus sp. AFS096315]PFM75661.1 phosphonate metabolism transcriptional regulator PhnF [Bacillus sp. AFS077874]
MINKNSPIPIYHQLLEYIKCKIASGEYPADELIPSEREFSEKFQISRMTVRQALNNLVQEGIVYRQKGKGTFVSRQKVEKKISRLNSYTEEMIERGLKPSSRLVQFDILNSDKALSNILKIKEKDPIYFIKRVRLADSIPMSIESIHVSCDIAPNLNQSVLEKSFFDYVNANIPDPIQYADQSIQARMPSEEEAQLLEIPPNCPVLAIYRTTYLRSGKVLEYELTVYRADRYKLVHSLSRND